MDTLYQQFLFALQTLWDKLAAFLPNLLAAVILLLLGWLLASLAAQEVQTVLAMLPAQVGRKLTLSGLGAWLVKWFVIVLAFVTAAEVLGLEQFNEFLFQQVLPYFGNVIGAIAILLIGAVVANFLSEVVRGSVRAA